MSIRKRYISVVTCHSIGWHIRLSEIQNDEMWNELKENAKLNSRSVSKGRRDNHFSTERVRIFLSLSLIILLLLFHLFAFLLAMSVLFAMSNIKIAIVIYRRTFSCCLQFYRRLFSFAHFIPKMNVCTNRLHDSILLWKWTKLFAKQSVLSVCVVCGLKIYILMRISLVCD